MSSDPSTQRVSRLTKLALSIHGGKEKVDASDDGGN